MSRSRRYQVFAVSGGLALSIFLLWLSLREVDYQSLLRTFIAVKPWPVAGCAFALWLGIRLRAVRWRFIASQSRQQQRHFSRATTLGVLSNLIFPGRAGEIIKIITLAKLTKSSMALPLASALIDRMIDVFVLLFSAVGLYFLFPISQLLEKWLLSFLGVSLILLFGLLLYVRGIGGGEAFIANLFKRWLRRWPIKLDIFMLEFRKELRRVVAGWMWLELILLAVLILLADYAAIASLLFAFDLVLPLEAPLLLWVFFSAGSALPSAPGYVGVYQVAAVWALALFEVPAASAIAVATMLQIMTLLVAMNMAGTSLLSFIKHRNEYQ